MPSPISTIADLSQAVSEFISTNFPGQAAIKVTIVLTSAQRVSVPVVAPRPAPRPDVRAGLSQLERRVYDVLSPTRGLTVAAISAKLDDYDQTTLHRRGIKPLVQKGLAIHDEDAGGFVRADPD